MIFLKTNRESFTLGDYSILNNQWGVPANLENSSKVFSSIALTDTAVNINWTFPDYQSPYGVWAYPEVFWGSQCAGTHIDLSTSVKNINSLVVNYSTSITSSVPYVRGNTAGANILIELWTKNAAGKLTNEIGVVVYGWNNPGGVPSTVYKDKHITTTQEVHYKWGDDWTYVTMRTNTDALSGKIDFGLILKDLVSKGIVDGNDTVSGIELGTEVARGSGSLVINKFEVSETVSVTRTITKVGTNNSDTFDLTTNNSYNILGNLGIDTVNLTGLTASATVDLSKSSVRASNLSNSSLVATSKITGIENITGTNFADKLKGNSVNNIIFGGEGNDIIDGGLGKDILTGNLGADVFVINLYRTASTAMRNFDHIMDYTPKEDHLAIDPTIFKSLKKISPDKFDQYIRYNVDTHILSYDVDGSKTYYAPVNIAKIDLVGLPIAIGINDFVPYTVF